MVGNKGGLRGENLALIGTGICAFSLGITTTLYGSLGAVMWGYFPWMPGYFPVVTGTPLVGPNGPLRRLVMPQIFPKGVNHLTRLIVLGLPMAFGATGVGLAAFYRSSYATGREEVVPQPVAFSHAHHVGQLGIHCLYCHTSVEDSHFAGIPPTKTCINCHQEVWTGADLLKPVRERATGRANRSSGTGSTTSRTTPTSTTRSTSPRGSGASRATGGSTR